MRVRMFTGGNPERDASAYYRMALPGRTLAAAGLDVTVEEQVPGVLWKDQLVTRPGQHGPVRDAVVVGLAPLDTDVAVFQRPVTRNMADVVAHAARQCHVVIDLDDDFFAIQRENAAYAAFDPARNPDRNWLHLRRALGYAHATTVTTPALAAKTPNATVLPNFVPAAYLELDVQPIPRERPWLGWAGSVKTHPRDLQAAGEVGALVAERDWDVHVVGELDRVARDLKLTEATQLSLEPWVPLPDYPRAISQFDLGIVPLATNPFNDAKSWLKGLEYASLGIPFVASSTPAYLELAKLGIGTLAERPRDWRKQLSRLMHSEQLRQDTAAQARAVVASRLTIERQAERWWDAWQDGLVRRRLNGDTLTSCGCTLTLRTLSLSTNDFG